MKFLLSRRSLLRVFPVLLLVAVTGYASIHGTRELLANDATISEAVHARYAARDLLFSMVDLETGMRGFVITGDEAYLGPFHSATASAGRQIDEMQRLLSDDPGQQQRIGELRSLVNAEIAASQRLVAMERASGTESASLAVKTGDTKVRMDRIRQVIAELLVAQDRSLDQQGLRGEYATRQARNALRTIVIANATAIIVVLFACYFVFLGDNRRHQAEQQLIASESRFRLLVDNVKEYAIFLLDREGRITTWNAGAERIIGYRADEIIGRHISCVYAGGEADREKVQAELRTALEKGQFEEDGWHVRKDQTRFWANDVVTPLFDPQGAHIGFSRITRDLTERKHAEEMLIASESRFRMLVDNAREYAIFLLDPEGLIKTWNAGAERIKGYQAEEIIGRHISCVYPGGDADREKVQAQLEIALENGQFEGDGWRVRKDQTRFWGNDVVTPLFDQKGAHIGFSRITRDISERKRAEEEVDRFFTLSLDLLCILGTDGYFKRLNPAWETTLGYTDAELRAVPFINFVHADDRPATLAMDAMLSAGQPVGPFENRFRCKDGSYRWMLWKSAGSGDRKLIYAAACDITERKAAENSIADLNRASQLRNMELEAANKELEAFSYSVSHDLRTPLRSLDGFSLALMEDYGDKLDGEGQENLHRIRAASQRMGQLIDDLMNLSRVTRVEMSREKVDVSKMARDVAEEVRLSEPGRAVEFVIADNLFANTDARLLRIVLTNLLSNAWKFTGKRSLARIEFGSSVENGTDSYFVRDNGAGFNMLYAQKLFGAFQRLHGATEFPGTGIGLAIVQRIVHRYGGRVWAEAKLDGGATFHFTLQPPLLCIAA